MDKIGKYQVIQHLGNGFFGDVFLCYDPFLQKEQAIKVIKVPNPDKFVEAIREGQVLDLCRHKHIVDVRDVGTTIFNGERVVFIVMEYLSKGSIQKHIEKRFISCYNACQIVRQALFGLEHAHNIDVLHRDIKPGNILFGDQGESKLSDFGFAINYHVEPSDTFGYRPHQPLEVIEGNPMDKLSDIYAMGITFYRLLNNTNKISFTFTTIDEWLKAVKKDLYPPRVYLKHIPEKIIRVLSKSIHKNKDTRYQSCLDFRQAIERLDFKIDWVCVDDDIWSGVSNCDRYELIKHKKRTGWIIDFKKNGVRRTENCCSNLPDDKVDIEYYKILRDTTLN